LKLITSKYPASENPVLAERFENLPYSSGFKTKREWERGFDHGTFVPLMAAYPEARIPVVQLPLVDTLYPETQLMPGKTLEPLRREHLAPLFVMAGSAGRYW
jgi:aromatic ring-opening dioxygenase catalytic subunit (LigB family)